MGKHVSNDSSDLDETTRIETNTDAAAASPAAGTSPSPSLTDEADVAEAAAPGASGLPTVDADSADASGGTASPGATTTAADSLEAPTTALPEIAQSTHATSAGDTPEADAASTTETAEAKSGETDGDDAASTPTTPEAAQAWQAAATLGAPGPTIMPERNIVLEGPGSRRSRPAPPPRPDFSLETPAPVLKEVPLTTPMKVTRVLWLVSFALGTAAILFAGLGDGPRRSALEALVTELATDQTAEVITALTNIVFWSSFAALLVVTLVEVILVATMFRGRGGARWALLVIVLILHVGIGLLADAFVAVDEGGLVITILIAAQWVVAAAAVTASLSPGSSDWFRAKREAQRNPAA